jgi:hypothetical protein
MRSKWVCTAPFCSVLALTNQELSMNPSCIPFPVCLALPVCLAMMSSYACPVCLALSFAVLQARQV